MKLLLLPLLAVAVSLSFMACERKVVVIEREPATPMPVPEAKTKTLETSRVKTTIDDFEREPTATNRAEVKKAFARLDEEIAELQEYIAKHDGDDRAKAAGKLQNMQSYRDAENLRFTAAQARAGVVGERPVDTRSGGEKVEDTTRKAVSEVGDGLHKAGDAIKNAVH